MRQKHKEEHDHLRVMIEDYVAMLHGDVAPDITEILKRRFALSNALRAHVAEEGPVFNRLRTGDPHHAADRALDEYSRRLRDAMPNYSALIQQWTPQRIVAEWPAYCSQVRTLVPRYHAYLAWEEGEVLPFLDLHQPQSCAS
ncbi:MAG: hypothetical protein J7485_09230 [Sphingobium sp.]|nr:hypothetical protein [Sphingobium sp.]